MWTLSKIVMLVFLFTMMTSVLYYQQWISQLTRVEQAKSMTNQVREGFNRALLPESLEARILVPVFQAASGEQYTIRIESSTVSGQKVVSVLFAYGDHGQAFNGPWDSATSLAVSSDISLDPDPFTINSTARTIEINKTVTPAGVHVSLTGCRLITSSGACLQAS